MTRGPAIAMGIVLMSAGFACGRGAPSPAALDTKNDTCSSCRMTVSDRRLAAQIVAPDEEPRFFDDLACLRTFLDAHQPDASTYTVYVADHRTGEWTPAAGAVYSRFPRASTPMASGLIAHATVGSRSQDTSAAGSALVGADAVLGSAKLAERRQP